MYSVRLLITFVVVTFSIPATHAQSLSPQQAPQHVGESATVCGLVASARHAERSKGQPTFLNLDKPFPDQIFTAIIWGSDREKFGTPEKLLGKKICITGKIQLYQGRAALSDPKQLN